MKSGRKMGRLAAPLTVLALIIAGCATAEQNPAPPAVPLEVSINAVMVGLVDHASHSIWDAAVAETAPKTDKDWEEVQHHAIQIAAAGSVIAMPGTGKSDAEWVKNEEWQRYAKELADTGVAAWDAAKAKDMKAISDVGDRLVTICENCHKAYKGELPTEGILHPH